jgi:hypothetical protein
VSKRKALHAKIAEWYESNALELGQAHLCSLLASHWSAVLENESEPTPDLLEKTINYLQASADGATRDFATEEATKLLQNAIRLADELPLSIDKRDLLKKLRLQLIGLPMRDIRGFSFDAAESVTRDGEGESSLDQSGTKLRAMHSTSFSSAVTSAVSAAGNSSSSSEDFAADDDSSSGPISDRSSTSSSSTSSASSSRKSSATMSDYPEFSIDRVEKPLQKQGLLRKRDRFCKWKWVNLSVEGPFLT